MGVLKVDWAVTSIDSLFLSVGGSFWTPGDEKYLGIITTLIVSDEALLIFCNGKQVATIPPGQVKMYGWSSDEKIPQPEPS